jgi:ABC-type lipoprotein release transport system permease subunit
MLFNVGRLDIVAFATMAAVMLAVALLASYVPALRASRVDPVVALRAE